MIEKNNSTYHYLLRDIAHKLKEEYYGMRKDLRSKGNTSDNDPGKAFLVGKKFGYYCCLEVIRNYGIVFQVPLKGICLEGEIPI